MKKLFIPCLVFLLAGLISCETKKETKTDTERATADSLQKEVDDGHNVSMSKYGKLRSMKLEAERMLDSIAKLPAKAQEAAAPLKAKLTGLVQELGDAKDKMDQWMREYDFDSAADNLKQRIQYLANEKLKIGTVKESIQRSIQRADSVIRAKF